MSTIDDWLAGLGLAQYADAFTANDIDYDLLPELNDQVLKDIGIESAGHRMRLLKAARAFQDSSTPEDSVPAAQERVAPAGAERRQITVMFCDLVGSTALSEAMDPEDLRALIGRYQQAANSEISKLDGHVAQYLGDGVMAYFGWPRAHEDDATRAVQAGLATIRAINGLDGADLSARIGIATGPVVVGDSQGGGEPNLAVGETPNLAARLQALAEPNAIVIGPTTRQLVGAGFAFQEMGAQSLKGMAKPIAVWRVIGEGAALGRFEAQTQAGLTPMVGRTHEIGLLLDRWQQAKDGDGQVVLLRGEPGIGKSRLTQVLRERVAEEPHIRLRYQCTPYHVNTGFHPIIGQFQRAAGFAIDDSDDDKLDKMEKLLKLGTADIRSIAPFFADLMSLRSDRYPAIELGGAQRRQRMIEILAEQVVNFTAQQPVLMIFEDAHWSDPTSLEALAAVIDRTPAHPVLVVITARPEFEPNWADTGHFTTLTMNRLGRRQAIEMIENVAESGALPDEVLEDVVAKTDGNPLFIEELTKAVLASDHRANVVNRNAALVPATLHDSLMARLDRLGAAKDVAQVASVIGREFSQQLLAFVTEVDDAALRRAIVELVDSEVIFQRGASNDAVYVFKHALVRDAAYQSLLKSTRQALHARIASIFTSELSDLVAQNPELVALHLQNAAKPAAALEYWLKAGQMAARRGISREAVAHAQAGLTILEAHPNLRESKRHELEFHVLLVTQYQTLEGIISSKRQESVERILELSKTLRATKPLCQAAYAIGQHYTYQGKLTVNRNAIEFVVELADADGDSLDRARAYDAYALVIMQHGQWRRALALADMSRRLLDEVDDASLKASWGTLPGIGTRIAEGYCYWQLGNVAATRTVLAESVAHAERFGTQIDLAFAWVYTADLCYFIRDVEAIKHAALMAAESSASLLDSEFPFKFLPEVHLGWAESQDGDVDKGLARMLGALDRFKESGARLFVVPRLTAEIAEVMGQVGRPEEGLDFLAQSPDRTDPNQKPSQFAEIYRIEGDLLRMAEEPDQTLAQSKYEHAIKIARDEESISWELRAGLALARLLHGQSQSGEAKALLSDIVERHPDPDASIDCQAAIDLLRDIG